MQPPLRHTLGVARCAPRRRLTAAALAAVVLVPISLAGCGSDANTDADYALPDGGLDVTSGAAQDVADTGAAPTDGAEAGSGTDAGVVDSGPPNAAPVFKPMQALILEQGSSTTLDLNPLLSDDHDAKHMLTISWSAKQVALQDPAGSHLLYVVAPTQWSGVEMIDLKVTDIGGLSAISTLTVTVTEVVVSQPKPPDTCGKVTFSIAAGQGDLEVLLSGTFNDWATIADKADKLADVAGTGVWSVEKKLTPGVHQYKFLVDGKWMADPDNPNQTPDGFGGQNSVIEVAPCAP